MKTSNRNIVSIGLASNLIPSWWLWMSSPTDTVRVWYPTIWSYLGEHFVLWVGFTAFFFAIARVAFARQSAHMFDPSQRGTRHITFFQYLFICLIFLASDLCTSFYLAVSTWWWEHRFTTRLWHTESLRDYLFAREPIFLVVLLVATFVINRPPLFGGTRAREERSTSNTPAV
jgi:hypothetical protein